MRRACLALVVALAGCHRESPAGAIATEAGAGAPEGEARPAAAPKHRRALWFDDGLGRDAILARERGDHAAAVAALDELLAQETLSPDDRAAAQLLRGLEDLRADSWAAAADRFAAARSAAALAPIDVRLRMLEAQARLDAGQPGLALELVRGATVDPGSALADDAIVIEADACARTDDVACARGAYERYIAGFRDGARRYEVKAKLARLLGASASDEDARAALALYEELLLESPLSDFGEEAQAAVPSLVKRVGSKRKGPQAKAFEHDVAIARIDALLDRHRYREATRAVDVLVAGKIPPDVRCRALFAKGTAIFKRRERAESRAVFEQAASACARAGAGEEAKTTAIKARYQAARGVYAAGKHAEAARLFETLAKDAGDHSYTDDAWVLAGESWAEAGKGEAATLAWRNAVKAAGDMREEALRRLLVQAFAEKDPARALAVADEALAGAVDGPAARAKLVYFRGRALALLGRADAAKAAWLDALRAAPLDYPALQALSRLRELGEEAQAEGLALLGSSGAALLGTSHAPKNDAVVQAAGSERALLLARLGLGEEAAEELRIAGVDGWPAIAVLNDAGLFGRSQKLLASLGQAWREQPPVAAARTRWELAHPLVFEDLIGPGESAHAVPSLLTFAVMQTESRFDPSAISFAGARGLLQLMPETATTLASEAGVDLGGEDRLHDPRVNLELGIRYLGKLAARWGGSDAAVALAVPSYNAGAGAVDRWIVERGSWDLDLFVEAIPYDETRKYTQAVLGRWLAYRWLYGDAAPAQRVPYLPLQLPTRLR